MFPPYPSSRLYLGVALFLALLALNQTHRVKRGKFQCFSVGLVRIKKFSMWVASRIGVIVPADEHGDASSHDVESSPLLFDQSSALSCKRAPSVRGGFDERERGGAGSGQPFFLGRLPFVIEVERGIGDSSSSSRSSCSSTDQGSHG